MYGCATKGQRRRFKAEARRNSYGDWWPDTEADMLRSHRARQERQRDQDVKLEVDDLEEQYRSGDYADDCYYDPSDPNSPDLGAAGRRWLGRPGRPGRVSACSVAVARRRG